MTTGATKPTQPTKEETRRMLDVAPRIHDAVHRALRKYLRSSDKTIEEPSLVPMLVQLLVSTRGDTHGIRKYLVAAATEILVVARCLDDSRPGIPYPTRREERIP